MAGARAASGHLEAGDRTKLLENNQSTTFRPTDPSRTERALGFGSWTATDRAGGQLMGLGGLRVHDGDHGVALRLAFIPQAQGRGYGPELGRAALAFAFDVADLDRVVAITRLDNLPGQRSLEKCGMVREREFTSKGGRYGAAVRRLQPEQRPQEPHGRTTQK